MLASTYTPKAFWVLNRSRYVPSYFMNPDRQRVYFPDGDLMLVADSKSEASALPYLDVKMTNNWKHDAKKPHHQHNSSWFDPRSTLSKFITPFQFSENDEVSPLTPPNDSVDILRRKVLRHSHVCPNRGC